MSTCRVPDCTSVSGHHHCISCGAAIVGEVPICAHHHLMMAGDDWAIANRVLCDLIHRRIEPARLPAEERDKEMSSEGFPPTVQDAWCE